MLQKLTLKRSTLCKLHPSSSSSQLNTLRANPFWPEFIMKRTTPPSDLHVHSLLPVSHSSLLWVFVADFLRPSCLFPVLEVHRSRPPRLLPGPRSTSWASGSTLSCGTPSIPHVVSVTVQFVTAYVSSTHCTMFLRNILQMNSNVTCTPEMWKC